MTVVCLHSDQLNLSWVCTNIIIQAAQFSSIETSTVIPMSDRALQSIICESISRIAQKKGGTVWTQIPGLASSRLLFLSSPLDKSSPQQKQSSPLLQRARRSGQTDLCKKLRDEFYLYLSRDKTCHKQYTIYMLPQGKDTKRVWRGHQTLPIFFLGGRARQTSWFFSISPIIKAAPTRLN